MAKQLVVRGAKEERKVREFACNKRIEKHKNIRLGYAGRVVRVMHRS